MNQELYQKAMAFAGEKHSGQLVPGTTANYLLHISNVAMEVMVAYQVKADFDINLAIQVAILHDTIEDTDADFEEVKQVFGMDVALGVQALTKDVGIEKGLRMEDSLNRINQLSKEVGLVKLADRITNLQAPPDHWPLEKVVNYRKQALLIAEQLKGKNEYLELRLKRKIEAYKVYT